MAPGVSGEECARANNCTITENSVGIGCNCVQKVGYQGNGCDQGLFGTWAFKTRNLFETSKCGRKENVACGILKAMYGMITSREDWRGSSRDFLEEEEEFGAA